MNLFRPALFTGVARQSLRHPIRLSRPLRCYSEKSEAKDAAPENSAPQQPTDSSSSSSSSDADVPAVKELKAKLEAKEAEVVDLTGRLRYSLADFQNLQRISKKEKEQTRDFAITRFATDLLDTIDVLTLALRSVPSSYASPPPAPSPEQQTPSSPDESSSASQEKEPASLLHELYQGVSLTNKQLLSTFEKYGIKQYDPTGQKFDPNLHEALYAAPIPGKEPGSVVETQKFGYMIKDRVLRAAQVGVVQEPPSSS